MATNDKVLEQDGRKNVHYWGPIVCSDVDESTAIIVERRGQFRKCIMENTGKEFNGNWSIVDSQTPQPLATPPPAERNRGFFGGLHYVGISKLDDVRHYNLRWKTSRMGDKVGEFRFYEKTLWYYTLRPTVLYLKVIDAETTPSKVFRNGVETEERIPVTLEILYTATIKNPFLVAYKAPDYWVEKGEVLIDSEVTGWVGTKTLDDIYSIQRTGSTQLWDDIKGRFLFGTLEKDWGWLISDMRIKSTTPPAEIQEAGMAQRKMEMLVDADLQETAVKWLKMLAIKTGLDTKEISQMMKDKPEEFKTNYGQISDECWEMVVLQTELKSKARFHLENEGGGGPEGWIALWKILGGNLGGGGAAGKVDSGSDSREKKKTKKIMIGGRLTEIGPDGPIRDND